MKKKENHKKQLSSFVCTHNHKKNRNFDIWKQRLTCLVAAVSKCPLKLTAEQTSTNVWAGISFSLSIFCICPIMLVWLGSLNPLLLCLTNHEGLLSQPALMHQVFNKKKKGKGVANFCVAHLLPGVAPSLSDLQTGILLLCSRWPYQKKCCVCLILSAY